MDPTNTGICPRCGQPLLSLRDAVSWCPACRWRLEYYEPERRVPEFGWRLVDRWLFRLAYRSDRRIFDALADGAAPWGPSYLVTQLAGLVLLAGIVCCAALGVWMVAWRFPTVLIVPGLLLVAIAVWLRPRFGRLDPDADVLDADTAPTLYGLIGRVAEEIGAPNPDLVTVDASFGASADTVGLRRRRVLRLGLPLWAILTPQERVALLAHQLGHYRDHDPRRSLLGQLTDRSLDRLSGLLAPTDNPRDNTLSGRAGAIAGSGEQIARSVLAVLMVAVWFTNVGLQLVVRRAGQRAEYRADELAARAAGTEAAADLTDELLAADASLMLITRQVRQGDGPDGWRAACDTGRVDRAGRLAGLRQPSYRDQAWLFADHPPDGLRHAMLTAHPHHTATVVLTSAEYARIDHELARRYEAAGKALATG